MNTRIILKDYAEEKQPKLLLLNSEKKNWRLYWNVKKEPANQAGEEEETAEQWSANYVPQPWQSDIVSDVESAPGDFRNLLSELGLSNEEIEGIIDE